MLKAGIMEGLTLSETDGLTLHPTKTRIVDMKQNGPQLDFLGFRFQRHQGKDGGDRLLRLVRPKSLDRIKDAIRDLTPRNMGHGVGKGAPTKAWGRSRRRPRRQQAQRPACLRSELEQARRAVGAEAA